MSPFQSYIICTSPRSGSTLLCALLRETNGAGDPGSHFHAPSFIKWLGYYGLEADKFDTQHAALTAIFQAAITRGKGKSDIFGLRLQHDSLAYFTEQLAVLHPDLVDDKSRFQATFGNTLFIHLTRTNKLDQAISYVKATQSGLWHKAPDGTELERLSTFRKPTYDAKAIAAQLARSQNMENAWAAWFAMQKITPLRISYDELAGSPYATRNRILEKLGLDSGAKSGSIPPVAKLADSTNHEWAQRFRLDHKL